MTGAAENQELNPSMKLSYIEQMESRVLDRLLPIAFASMSDYMIRSRLKREIPVQGMVCETGERTDVSDLRSHGTKKHDPGHILAMGNTV